MPTVSGWWRSRSDPQRIDLYTRWSYWSTLLGLPVLALFGAAPLLRGVPTVAVVLLVLGAAATAAGCLLATRRSFEARARAEQLPLGAVLLAVVPASLTAAAGVWALAPLPGQTPAVPWAVGLCAAMVLVTLSVVWTSARLVPAAAGAAVLVGAATLLDGNPPLAAVVIAASIGASLLGVAWAFRFTVWVLDVVQQMERTRGVQLQLAVAEERLRFARDLHDVMGRNLSVIAVKSQLAGELVRRGRDGAAEEVAGISRIAEDSLREVREVVRGYRATDLAGELAGARSVLRAAGVACVVSGEDRVAALPEPVQVLLGWVVREAVTNVLRHSSAERCDISLASTDVRTTLTVTNDGAHGGDHGGDGGDGYDGDDTVWGNGLSGLAERVAAAGGRLTAGRSGRTFTVTAGVPA